MRPARCPASPAQNPSEATPTDSTIWMQVVSDAPAALETVVNTAGGTASSRNRDSLTDRAHPLRRVQRAVHRGLLRDQGREHMRQEHRDDRPGHHADYLDQVNLRPAVVHDQDAHHRDRAVDHSVDYERRFERTSHRHAETLTHHARVHRPAGTPTNRHVRFERPLRCPWRCDPRVGCAPRRAAVQPMRPAARHELQAYGAPMAGVENDECSQRARVLRGAKVGSGAAAGSPPRIGSNSLGHRTWGNPEAAR